MEYKISQYTKWISIDPKSWYVYNLASGCECILDAHEMKTLKECGVSQAQTYSDQLMDSFYKMGIVVDKRADEIAVQKLLRLSSIYNLSDSFGIVIAPTMDCNAKCFYCYESDTRMQEYMDSKTEEALLKYIKKMALGKKKLFVSWFGGEPLLCVDLIERLSQQLISYCIQNNIEYDAELTTNGALLNQDASFYKAIGISEIQITLDGCKEKYEKRKHFDSIPNAWEKVIGNIFSVSSPEIHTTIRFNFDKENLQDVSEAAKILIENPKWNNNISIYFYPIEPLCDCFSSTSAILHEELYEEAFNYLYQKLYEYGYYNDRPNGFAFNMRCMPCYSATLSMIAVDYLGRLYHCQHLLCHTDEAIGDVVDGIPVTTKLLSWFDGSIPDKCDSCEVLPLCQGGCITKRHLGQSHFLCQMIKYRLAVRNNLVVKQIKKGDMMR